MGCDECHDVRHVAHSDFNPRTPVGCDCHVLDWSGFHRISIHAPQWGATISAAAPNRCHYFNPRTPVGCDSVCLLTVIPASVFQSTHPSGVRLEGGLCWHIDGEISIHAPQWGATRRLWFGLDWSRYFNPRTPVGCDGPRFRKRGVKREGNFNPRTPVGCDGFIPAIVFLNRLFQSTHPSGVRPNFTVASTPRV